MLKPFLLIVNPNAGRGEYKNGFSDALLALSRAGYAPTVYFTRAPGDAINFVEECGSDFDIVACIGGDGTLSEVLSGLMKLKKRPKLGYIPMGTTNDVATTLDIPKNNALAAVLKMLRGEAHPYDVGGFGDDEFFSYIAAFGAFTEISYTTPQDQKKVLGHLAYVLQGALALPKITSVNGRVEYDGGVFEGPLIYGSMSNSTSVAGIIKLKEDMVRLGDGFSELVLVRDPKTPEAFASLVSSVLSQSYEDENLLIIQTRKARFTFEKPVAWTRDGESGGEHDDITLCNYRAPIEFIF